MRQIKIGDKEMKVRATALTLLYYKQEFNSDLVGDLLKVAECTKDPTKVDTILLLQMVWAMAKTEAFATKKPHPGFVEWLNQIDRLDMSDPSFFAAVMEEAADGFLSRGRSNTSTR